MISLNNFIFLSLRYYKGFSHGYYKFRASLLSEFFGAYLWQMIFSYKCSYTFIHRAEWSYLAIRQWGVLLYRVRQQLTLELLWAMFYGRCSLPPFYFFNIFSGSQSNLCCLENKSVFTHIGFLQKAVSGQISIFQGGYSWFSRFLESASWTLTSFHVLASASSP